MAEHPHLRFVRDEVLESGRGLGLKRPANILLYSSRGDSHFFVDLVGESLARSSWRDAPSALSSVEQGKWDKHSTICRISFDFIHFCFSTYRPFSPTVEELIISGAVHTHGSLSGRRMLGCYVGSPVLLWKGLQGEFVA